MLILYKYKDGINSSTFPEVVATYNNFFIIASKYLRKKQKKRNNHDLRCFISASPKVS